MDGVLTTMLRDGFPRHRLIPIENKTVVTSPREGCRNNRWEPVLSRHGVTFTALPEVEWRVYRFKSPLLKLNEIFPDGIQIPAMYPGRQILHLPTVKTHGHAVMTGSVKNSFGGLLKEVRHYAHKYMHEVLVDLLYMQRELHPAVFTVMDGTVAGDGAGPRTMIPRVKNLLLAASDSVAIDAIAARLMGFDPLSIPFLRMAHERGLGIADPRQIELVGDDVSRENFGFTTRKSLVIWGDQMIRNGFLRPLERLLLHSPLMVWAPMASNAYHDLMWYPTIGRSRIREFNRTEWGKLFQKYYHTMADQNPQHGRRQHFHRGRRGQDRRGNERRAPAPAQSAEQGVREHREHVDVEQIMREIRTRISQRHGIELTTQQIQELAARRLEAILDPRTVKPSLLEQIRRSTSTPVDTPPATELSYDFEDTTLYDSHRGSLRFIRRLLNPLLKLFFNPNPMISALSTQSRLNKAAAQREAERDRRQAEWNALHYEILQRLVLEISRTSLESQQLSMRVEALSAKVEFAERRARSLEGALHQARPTPRQEERTPPMPQAPPADKRGRSHGHRGPPAALDGGTGEGGRRRRRRRRGRRPQPFTPEGATIGAVAGAALPEALHGPEGIEPADADELDDDERRTGSSGRRGRQRLFGRAAASPIEARACPR